MQPSTLRRWGLRWATGRTRCDPLAAPGPSIVIRWLIVVFLALLIFSNLHKWLERIGLGRLPGDFRFRLFGRDFFIPFTSAVVLSTVVMLLTKLV